MGLPRQLLVARNQWFVKLALVCFVLLMLLSVSVNWEVLQQKSNLEADANKLPVLERIDTLPFLEQYVHEVAAQQPGYDPRTPVCAPKTLAVDAITYHEPQDGSFYSLLKARKDRPVSPPIFTDQHSVLCYEEWGITKVWDYCLPISGRKDEPHCSEADRMDLLHGDDDDNEWLDSICYASVLHMLLIDVYEEIRALGRKPAVLYGTLLGAVRNESIIPYTEDADIGYQQDQTSAHDLWDLKMALWAKGYHMFYSTLWRVCVSPTHPLASQLYNSKLPLINLTYAVPYVDLYLMEPESFGSDVYWSIDEIRNNRLVYDAKVVPYSHVRINGREFDTVRDVKEFLRREYGDEYMEPIPR
uniref:Uncharacterized protein n=1 Tax=Globisporangium ultimum (strain ATCC 200006 / CBS 805.95 / DAOM BR144) TaxID=431595 RepID=K3XBF1_GLOUD